VRNAPTMVPAIENTQPVTAPIVFYLIALSSDVQTPSCLVLCAIPPAP
jgi:hypothetical protein